MTVGFVRVLLVSVCVSVVPTTVPDGAVVPAHVVKLAAYACTLVPMARPKLVRAVPVFATSDKLLAVAR